ncbi:PP2C family serine/threonine-protein phosphatase [Zoogloea sp.]|uniref:PP2C family protein-serine/threonine phosphatase n=1 Tax=Zoogloea sp. TaxID=49181 RepID=UPI0026072FE9|nr:PP2C family serine/threonine-protein phosphatase [Zoogloea sp.]MDD3352899.1 serine/threonine-protein phosphatase [Zoogloea sp.]
MRFTIYQESRVGKRRTNQDRVAYSYTRDALLMVLADGMGGHLYGEIAAQLAVQFIAQSFQQEARPKVTDPILFLSRVISNAHHAILDYAFDKQLSDVPRTTIVTCLIQDGVAHWAHAGDSRLYMIRRGKVVAQTRDHSRVQMMLDQGLLDAEAAAVHPSRNRIFSCLGGNHPPQIEFSRAVPLTNGDVLALCSDGVWGHLESHTLASFLENGKVMEGVPRLMNEAERLGGAQCDNLSLIAMSWHDDHPEADGPDSVSTRGMAADAFTTQMEGFGRSKRDQEDLSEDEIERAIREINAAIHKFK